MYGETTTDHGGEAELALFEELVTIVGASVVRQSLTTDTNLLPKGAEGTLLTTPEEPSGYQLARRGETVTFRLGDLGPFVLDLNLALELIGGQET